MKNDIRNKPIGIFDSGVGGLTVLKEIIKRLPEENVIYLGDTARVPYGIRSPETVIKYSLENTKFLFTKDIKLLVIACNTSSSISLEVIKKAVDIPVVGVIYPGARSAVKVTKNKKVGVIGTEATIRSESYTKAIKELDPDIKVYGLPCPLFVPLVEEGWTKGDIVEKIAGRYLKSLKKKKIDTLVLGCTHYPLLKKVISRVMGRPVVLVDSAIETAIEVEKILSKNDLLKKTNIKRTMQFYVTDSPERFLQIGERFLGHKINKIEKVLIGN
jgi:glutamate racemase